MANFYAKGQTVNILAIVGHMVTGADIPISLTTVQFCCCNTKTVIEDIFTKEPDCAGSNKTLSIKTEFG